MSQTKRIFISYSHKDKNYAINIESRMEIFHIAEIVRDERHLKFTESLESFMKRIRETDYAMILISDSFLKSPNCMYEILELFKDDDFTSRLLPIVINSGDNAARIYSDNDIINYVLYWQRQTEKLSKKLSKINKESMGDLHRQLNMFNKITQTIAEFCELLRKTKHTHPEKLIKEDYKEILEKLTFIGVNPKDLPKARNSYGLALGEFDIAKRIAFLDRALGYNPNYIEALKERGLALDSIAKHELALVDLNRAIELAPKDHTHYINRGITFKNMNDYDSALSDFNYSIVLYPEDAVAYNNIADIYRRVGDLDKAIENINIAIKLEPDLSWIWSTMSEICAVKSDHDGFYENMEKAIELGFPLSRFLHDEIYHPYVLEGKFLRLIELSKKNDRMP